MFILKNKGFTLIELLVVISIIGLLMTLAIVSLGDARMKSRDARRKADLAQISKALDLYYDQNESYPSTGATSASSGGTYSRQVSWLSSLISSGVMSKAPVDPVNIDRGPWCWGGSATQSTIYTYASDCAPGLKIRAIKIPCNLKIFLTPGTPRINYTPIQIIPSIIML
jgi:prepilin-type N-terminal cleavage/methylation domain-containing protein